MPSKKTFLWKIQSPEIRETSYLFGTMHVQDLRAFGRLNEVKKRILDCEAFAVEFNLDQAMGMALGAGMILPGSQRLSELMPSRKYEKLRNIILKSTSLDIRFFQRTLPMMLTGMIASQILQRDMPESLDEHLWKFARSEGKTLFGIETLDEQLEVLKKIPLEVQMKMLLDLGANIKRFRKHTLHTTALYEKGELQKLSKSVSRNARGLRHVLLYRRNEIMAERIHAFSKEQPIFAAIGAGHLGGSKGVIRLLKNRGLSLVPIPGPS